MSLAIADLLVTTTVMIPGFITEIKQKWIFGQIFCNIYVANDITFCTASILHLGKIRSRYFLNKKSYTFFFV